jgi:hypothetical protein
MGGNMRVRPRVKPGALAVAGSAALLVLTAGSALASTHSVTGPEVISGAVYGEAALANTPVIPVRLRGVVGAHGTLTPSSSKSHMQTVPSSAGTLVLHGTGYTHTTQSANPETCLISFTEDLTFTVVGSKSTGAFAGASGPGAAHVYFAAFEPKYTSGKHKGQCNENANPLAKGAVASILASIVLTIRQ